MQDKIKKLIDKSVVEIIERCASDEKIDDLISKHSKKIHFIPSKYRVLGGLLQSMNIQFGNFIENLMKNLVANEDKYEIIEKYNGKKSNTFTLSKINEQIIDEYITNCQTQDMDVNVDFVELQKQLFENNKRRVEDDVIKFKHDIDLLFRCRETGKIYYLEIKYNDDHDTGKFVDINRKFIKTYAYLLSEFKIEKYNDIIPFLFFFNNKKMKGNIYVPEKINIRRGKKFFDEFLTTSYQSVDDYLTELSENPSIIKRFDGLYEKVVKR